MSQAPAIVDLASDTATRPSPGMREAMVSAPLGDEQRHEDPTVNLLQERVAALLGHETALFLPSATMANQIALALHCQAGDEVVCHRSAHVFNYEVGCTAMTARAQTHPLDGERGIFDGAALAAAIRPDDPHLPRTAAVVVENTSNGGGGSVWPDAAFDSVVEVARAHDVRVHIDGARLMNAAIKAGVSPARWAAQADTAQMCFSKGLGCPFGAVLAMPSALWPRARRLKQGLGGALRQAGVIAGAMLYALDYNVERLADDHRRARALADALGALDGLSVEPCETNLVFFTIERPDLDAPAFCAKLSERGVRMAATVDGRVRACLHLDVDDAGLDRAIDAAKFALG